MGIRKKIFTIRMVKHWHMLPRLVDLSGEKVAPFLEIVHVSLDRALSTLMEL